MWPKFPPQNCISIKIVFKKIINEIKFKKFPLLTLDFRLATLSKCIYKDFNIINKFLTYYFKTWWRKLSKFKNLTLIGGKEIKKQAILVYFKNNKNMLNFDYYITSIINLNIFDQIKKNLI